MELQTFVQRFECRSPPQGAADHRSARLLGRITLHFGHHFVREFSF